MNTARNLSIEVQERFADQSGEIHVLIEARMATSGMAALSGKVALVQDVDRLGIAARHSGGSGGVDLRRSDHDSGGAALQLFYQRRAGTPSRI